VKTVFLFHAGFEFDNSSGEFSEANKITGMIDLDTSKSTRSGKSGERSPQENGIQKHRYVVSQALSQDFPKHTHNHPQRCWRVALGAWITELAPLHSIQHSQKVSLETPCLLCGVQRPVDGSF
jgi:hypothetical protein